jgi:hypothetical protein
MSLWNWAKNAVLIVVLSVCLCPAIALAARDPIAVPTFHCIGLYWNPEDGSTTNICRVRYRCAGSREWKEALPLWFDARGREAFSRMFSTDKDTDQSAAVQALQAYSRQYRGSIVNLTPGTDFEIELFLDDTKRRALLKAKTWSEDFPVSKTVLIAGPRRKALIVSESGSPGGYILYTHPRESDTATIDVGNQEDQCIEVRASHVIIRGLTLRGARAHGIRIFDGSHDVIIEDCDISGWGRPDDLEGEKWGRDMDSGIYARELHPLDPTIARIVVQRCRIHHPRHDTNSWSEYRKRMDPDRKDTRWHPGGPQAISFINTRGGHVVRYNDIWSDKDHYYNDIFGGGSNFSAAGSPNRDSDIYCNRLERCWDDGIEAEGANCNVRIWGNYISHTMVSVATAATHVGPLYIWRNVSGVSQSAPGSASGGPFLKAGLNRGFGGGRTFVFHNTFLQPPLVEGDKDSQGVLIGLSSWGGGIINHVSRNNILDVFRSQSDSIQERSGVSKDNDFDYDLYNGRIRVAGRHEEHGVKGKPIYGPGEGPARFGLAPESPGYDAGFLIPNFNDNYEGKAPDIGAWEVGTPPMKFGAANP